MVVQSFGDRWTYANPTLAALNPATLTDQSLAAASPDFVRYATQVRGHSVLLRQKSFVEIYHVATLESDPRIALYLAAAKNPDGRRLFPTMEAVKATMFGPASESDSQFIDTERNIFVQGVWRVSVALTAARLIGQLAQIEEQAKHSIWLEKQALKDLEELLRMIDVDQLQPTDAQEVQEFVFEERQLNLTTSLQARIFMPSASFSHWTVVGTYTGRVSTALLCSEIANAINERCLAAADANILAAPILAGGDGLHRIHLSARRRDAIIAMDAVTVAFEYGGQPLPFLWGVRSDQMTANPINSALLVVRSGRVSALTAQDETSYEPIVIYFRRASLDENGDPLDEMGQPVSGWQMGQLTFRISPTMTENKTVAVDYLPDEDRPSQVATLLLNELHSMKGEVKALGALFRNDPASPNALTAMELIAWTVTSPEAWIILDILDIPADLLMAVGNLRGPFTAFSRKPRSIRVTAKFFADAGILNTNSKGALPRIIKPPESSVTQRIRDKIKTMNPYQR